MVTPLAPQQLAGILPRQAVRMVQDALQAAGCPDADYDARELLRIAAGKDPRLLFDPLTRPQAECLAELAAQRMQRVPLQYLAGEWDFLGLTFKVGPGVLCPRADTELLCETGARLLAGKPEPAVLDLCAGSGCVGLGLKRLVPGARVTALEKSPEAFHWLQKNAASALPGSSTGAPALRAVQGDVFGFEAQLAPGGLDLILANPPYVTEAELALLAPELSFEPREALYAPGEGLAFYRHIAPAYQPALAPGGWLAFEIGWQQGAAVQQLLLAAGYQNVKCRQDLSGNDRVVLGQKTEIDL